MPSRRDLIITALVTKLTAITVLNGYNNNISVASGGGGVQEADAIVNQFGKLPTILISAPSEDQIEQFDTVVTKQLRVALLAAPLPNGTTAIERLIDDLVEDMERVLLTEAWAEPVLGVAGCDELRVHGHDKLPVDGESIDGAILDFTVQYRHAVTDPRAFP